MDEIVDDNHRYQPFNNIFSHHSDQQLIAIVIAETLYVQYVAKNLCENFLIMQKLFTQMVRSLRLFSE